AHVADPRFHSGAAGRRNAGCVRRPGAPSTRLVVDRYPRSGGLLRALSASLEQPPPLPVCLAPRVCLDLAPVPAFTRSVGRIAALAHYALEAPMLGYAQQRQTVVERFGQ